MRKYRKYNWPVIIKEFEQSGLTQLQYCENKEINPRYFSQRRSKYLATEQSGFTKVEVSSSSVPSKGLIIEVGRCRIQCPSSMSAQALATLVHSLA